jgi:hypothetical protein
MKAYVGDTRSATLRALTHVMEIDVEGAEILDSRWGQITVKYNGNRS